VQFQIRTGEISTPITYAELATKLGIAVGEKAPVIDTRNAVMELRASKGMLLNPNDKDSWSAGSFFTNPIVSTEVASALPEGAPKWPTADGRVKTSAAWLIEHSGIDKGQTHGGARISTKHVLALTNSGNATAEELVQLAREVRASVLEKFGITLEPEVNLVGVTL
jgi:UDP-N-acetylmuramate dehydrogenase